jgi:hypothetical protein
MHDKLFISFARALTYYGLDKMKEAGSSHSLLSFAF